MIGVTYVVTLLAAGRWTYTDVLADLATGMANAVGIGVALLLALFAGALLGGWTAARWRSGAPSAAQLVRCFAGGVLMGWGSLLIPGSNDGLILIGIPLLYPYAWLAFATMCLTIAAALWHSGRGSRGRGPRALTYGKVARSALRTAPRPPISCAGDGTHLRYLPQTSLTAARLSSRDGRTLGASGVSAAALL